MLDILWENTLYQRSRKIYSMYWCNFVVVLLWTFRLSEAGDCKVNPSEKMTTLKGTEGRSADNSAEFDLKCNVSKDDSMYKIEVCSQDDEIKDLEFCLESDEKKQNETKRKHKSKTGEMENTCRPIRSCLTVSHVMTYHFHGRVRSATPGVRCLRFRDITNGKFQEEGEFWEHTLEVYTANEDKYSYLDINQILEFLILAGFNFLVGFTLNMKYVRDFCNECCYSCLSCRRECSWWTFFVTIVYPRAWKVGLGFELIFMPIYGFIMAYLVLRSSECEIWNELNHMGLFVLSTMPVRMTANWFAKLYDGDTNLTSTMALISYIICPGFWALWWNTLGSVIPQTEDMYYAIGELYIYLGTLILPMFPAMAVRYKFPELSYKLNYLAKPFFFVGLCGMIFINHMRFDKYRHLLVLRQTMSALGFSWGGAMLACGICYACRLEEPEIIAVGLSILLQNHWVAFHVLMSTIESPESDMAVVIPAAQVYFTTYPLMIMYVVWVIFTFFTTPEPRRSIMRSMGCHLHYKKPETPVAVVRPGMGTREDSHQRPKSVTPGHMAREHILRSPGADTPPKVHYYILPPGLSGQKAHHHTWEPTELEKEEIRAKGGIWLNRDEAWTDKREMAPLWF